MNKQREQERLRKAEKSNSRNSGNSGNSGQGGAAGAAERENRPPTVLTSLSLSLSLNKHTHTHMHTHTRSHLLNHSLTLSLTNFLCLSLPYIPPPPELSSSYISSPGTPSAPPRGRMKRPSTEHSTRSFTRNFARRLSGVRATDPRARSPRHHPNLGAYDRRTGLPLPLLGPALLPLPSLALSLAVSRSLCRLLPLSLSPFPALSFACSLSPSLSLSPARFAGSLFLCPWSTREGGSDDLSAMMIIL